MIPLEIDIPYSRCVMDKIYFSAGNSGGAGGLTGKKENNQSIEKRNHSKAGVPLFAR